ncbi:MAG: hypothetical protein IJS15_17030 [Victivallales bacterium]|nr:hypothetical protein [Victivallales bacterium]
MENDNGTEAVMMERQGAATRPLLGAEERWMMLSVTGRRRPLGYPRRPMKTSDGQDYEEYEIPEADKTKVLKELYLFDNVPAMDEVMLDIHSGTTFKVAEYKAIRQDGGNFLVAPLYAEHGGTLLDWSPVDLRRREGGSGEIGGVGMVVIEQKFDKTGNDEQE